MSLYNQQNTLRDLLNNIANRPPYFQPQNISIFDTSELYHKPKSENVPDNWQKEVERRKWMDYTGKSPPQLTDGSSVECVLINTVDWEAAHLSSLIRNE